MFLLCNHYPNPVLGYFCYPNEILHTHSPLSSPNPNPRKPLIYFLSLWFTLSRHWNKIIQHVALCDWLLPLSLTLSRSIRVVYVTVSPSFLLPNSIPLCEDTHFVPSPADGYLRGFFLLFLAIRHNAGWIFACESMCGCTISSLLGVKPLGCLAGLCLAF